MGCWFEKVVYCRQHGSSRIRSGCWPAPHRLPHPEIGAGLGRIGSQRTKIRGCLVPRGNKKSVSARPGGWSGHRIIFPRNSRQSRFAFRVHCEQVCSGAGAWREQENRIISFCCELAISRMPNCLGRIGSRFPSSEGQLVHFPAGKKFHRQGAPGDCGCREREGTRLVEISNWVVA